MEVILKEDIDKLGHSDELVTVKNGYARNYLIPQGKAVAATPSAKKMHEETLRQRAHKESKVLDEAQAIAAKLEGVALSIGAKAGENGKIFGSVNSIQLAEALSAKGFNIERKNITLENDAIKEIGEYEATIKIHKKVSKTVKFSVVSE